ncbi:expressed unknown protein [Seminavis robusta]|uniref:PDZ domain-containing protein n=1 Tax=Seminavis robusta TaxID=568900 RepID=A0A9N8DIV9_9STRA|nr:expressed unknown protein [Seminavis robusta]|eukprot:Sro166_g074160.1 n/a (256) ;mRNA; r:45578-46345
MPLKYLLLLTVTLSLWWSTNAFLPTPSSSRRIRSTSCTCLRALGDFTVELAKPLGLILEERDAGGVYVNEVAPGGSAAAHSSIVPGDVLLKVVDTNVEAADFDTVMDLIVAQPGDVPLTLGDGLGTLDMPKNVVNQLQSTEDAYFVDAVVRQAVREARMRNAQMGDLIQVEVVVGAGVQQNQPQPQQQQQQQSERAMVRFFAIFSTDGVSSYSCNVAATGVRSTKDGPIEIVSLSCAKDEGLGQTFDLILEQSQS